MVKLRRGIGVIRAIFDYGKQRSDRFRLSPPRLPRKRIGELGLVARADAVITQFLAHLHLRHFKATQIFREIVACVVQRLAQHHPVSGGRVRAYYKSGFKHQHRATKNHLRHGEITNGLRQGFFRRFQQFLELRRE